MRRKKIMLKKKLIQCIWAWLLIVAMFSQMLPAEEIHVLAADITKGASTSHSYVDNTGKTYYIDADYGNDENSGLSEEEAWASLEHLNNTTFEPGDAILLKRGCTWTDTFIYPKGSGDENNQNYISCYGEQDQPLPVIVTSYDDSMDNLPPINASVYLGTDQNYWTIENLDITVTSNNAKSIVRIQNSSLAGVEIKNCVLKGGDGNNWSSNNRDQLCGILVTGYIKGILLENNEIYHCKATGINVDGNYSGCNYKGEINESSGKNVVVRNNYLENIGGNGILINNCLNPLVEYNVVNKSHSYVQGSACAGFWPFACYGALFQYNEAYNTRTIYDGMGFDCDYNCYYTTFQYNYSHNNVGGFMLVCVEPEASWMPGGHAYNVGSTVRYNISQNDYHYVFTLTGATQKTRIYNNTIYNDANACSNDGMRLTSVFFEYSKGKNTLSGLEYADDLLIANNIFYLDTQLNILPSHCTNVVYKNNMHTGRKYNNGVANGEVTYVLDSQKQPTDTLSCKESSGNINGYAPGFVEGGMAGTGRESCNGYMLYQDSKAIGAGIAIEDGYHECPNDFFGNPIDKKNVNIGAYAGKGVAHNVSLYDGKYKTIIDFERNIVGACGIGESKEENSGIYRCIWAEESPVIVEDKEVANPQTNSEKCLLLKNNQDTEKKVSAAFYVYPSEVENANGVRVYLDPQEKPTSFTISFQGKDEQGNGKEYSKTITASKKGWYVFTFQEKYGDTVVTPELLREMTEIKVSATLEKNQYIYVDDIQVNTGDMDQAMDYSFQNEEVEISKLITTFDGLEDVKSSLVYGYRGAGPSEHPGIATVNGRKAVVFKSLTDISTSVSFGYRWEESINAIKEELGKSDIGYEGLELNLEMVGYETQEEQQKPLSDEAMYLLQDTWNTYKISLRSESGLNYVTQGGTEATTNFIRANVKADSNNMVRISFEDMYFTYQENGKTYTQYVKEYSQEEIAGFLQDLSAIEMGYTTCGSILKKKVTTMVYLYSISAYKGVKHTESQWRILKKPTCTEKGLKEIVCTECGKCLKTEELECLGHDMETICEKPTCLADGYEQERCRRCDYETEKKILEKTGHSLKRVETKKATCTEDGEGYDICENCGIMLHEFVVFQKKEHDYQWVTLQEATKEQDGLQKEICSVCKDIRESRVLKFHTEEDEDSHVEVIDPAVPAGCLTEGFTQGSHCTVCGRVLKEQQIVPAKGHTVVLDDAVDATCTTKGKTQGSHCSVCGEIFVEQKPIPAAHTYATQWSYDEVSHWISCEKCEKSKDVGAHEWDAGTVKKEATELEDGCIVYTCLVCYASKEERIPALVKPTVEPSVKPTAQPTITPTLTIKPSTMPTATPSAELTITATPSAKPTATVVPKKGTKYTDAKTKAVYKITKAGKKNGTVEYVKSTNEKATKITIPATVKLDGIPYSVTSIEAKAFRKNKKITTVTIGTNVVKIGKEAFYGCSKLKKITIKSTKITRKNVGSKAFKGIYKNAYIKLPASKYKTYQKIINNAGAGTRYIYKK